MLGDAGRSNDNSGLTACQQWGSTQPQGQKEIDGERERKKNLYFFQLLKQVGNQWVSVGWGPGWERRLSKLRGILFLSLTEDVYLK